MYKFNNYLDKECFLWTKNYVGVAAVKHMQTATK